MGLVKRFDLYLMIVMLMCLGFTLSNGYKFYVGGKDGWVLTPSEDYSHWSHRNRFQINDTLLFKYEKGKDSVLEVTEEEYNTCNRSNPITSLTDGYSLFSLNRSGSFFFISGNAQNCVKGPQKLAIKVMSAAHHSRSPRHPSQSPSPSPLVSQSPSPSPLLSSHQSSAPNAPAPSPLVSSHQSSAPNALAPAPEPASNSACLVGPGIMVLGIMILSSMF